MVELLGGYFYYKNLTSLLCKSLGRIISQHTSFLGFPTMVMILLLRIPFPMKIYLQYLPTHHGMYILLTIFPQENYHTTFLLDNDERLFNKVIDILG